MGDIAQLEGFRKAFVDISKKFGFSFPEEKQALLTPTSGSYRIRHLGSYWGIEDGVL
ncbi:hypothetical protein Pmar_PMAR013362, partial [Perkinsus marinus ATCC 50983]